jgi:hypothetical protein
LDLWKWGRNRPWGSCGSRPHRNVTVGRVVSTPLSYSVGQGSKSRPGDRLSPGRFMFSSDPPGKWRRSTLR